jgi:endonuclease/exonuclease/phosphatase family metal-dependent hydrolase
VSLRILFWNCGVAPTRGKRKRGVEEVARIVDVAFKDGVTIVALCEVDGPAMSAIASRLTQGVACHIALTAPVATSRWDLGVFFRTGAIQCNAQPAALGKDHGKTIKAAHSVIVYDDLNRFRLYLLHWRSRLRGEREYRKNAAITLYRSVCDDLRQAVPIVILGDFNEEPHDPPLTELHASRDPVRVLKDADSFLYNPSWTLACPPHRDPWGSFGSFSYSEGRTSSAYLLDQALTSAHFLNEQARTAPTVRVPDFGVSHIGPSGNDHSPLELTLPWKTPTHSTTP